MNRRVAVVVLLLAALAAAWWMLRGEGVAPGSSGPDAVHADDPDARSETPRAGRRGPAPAEPGDAPAGATVYGGVYIAVDPDEPAPPLDPSAVEIVVYAYEDPAPGDFMVPPPSTIVASARAGHAGLFDIPLPPSPDGRPFLVTARGVDADITAEWHEVPPGGGRVEIRVEPATPATAIEVRRSDDGTPVADATVRIGALTVADKRGRSAQMFVPRRIGTTDAAGRTAVDARVDEHALVTAPGFAIADARIRRGRNVIELGPGDSVAGTIVRPDGTPVAGARIELRAYDGVSLSSDRAGRFRIDGLALGGAHADISAPGTRRRVAMLSPGDLDARIVLSPADQVIHGVVLLPDGQPAAGAAVWDAGLAAAGGFDFDPVNADDAGRFALRRRYLSGRRDPDLRDATGWGRRLIRARSFEAADDLNAVKTFDGQAVASPRPDGLFDDVEIQLVPTPSSWVVARIHDERGIRPDGLIASVAEAGPEPARADGAERFRVSLPPGAWTRVTVRAESGVLVPPVTRSVRTAADDAGEPIEIRVPTPKPLRVTVDAGGAGVREVTTAGGYQREDEQGIARVDFARGGVHWSDEGPGPPLATTEDSVTVLIDVDSPGLLVSVACEGLATEARQVTPEELAAGECHVRLRAGYTVTGRLPVSKRGEPVAPTCRLESRGPFGHLLQPARAETDGTFAFENVGPGTWNLVYLAPEWVRTVPRTFEVRSDVSLGAIDTPAIARVRGTVRYADGRPAGGTFLRFVGPRDDGNGRRQMTGAHARSDGSFDLRAERGAAGTLTVSKDGFGTVVVALTADETTAVPPLVLPPEGRVEVRVRAPRDVDPACRVHFEATSPIRAEIDAPLADDEVWTTRPDERFDHVAVHRGLAPGRVLVIAEGRGWRLEAPVTVVAGETAVVTLGDE